MTPRLPAAFLYQPQWGVRDRERREAGSQGAENCSYQLEAALGGDLESIRHTGALFSEKGLCTPLAPGVGGEGEAQVA